jgi:hypothetical protein
MLATVVYQTSLQRCHYNLQSSLAQTIRGELRFYKYSAPDRIHRLCVVRQKGATHPTGLSSSLPSSNAEAEDEHDENENKILVAEHLRQMIWCVERRNAPYGDIKGEAPWAS